MLLGEVVVDGEASPLERGRELFTDGDYAYIGHFNGYSVVDVSDPTQPIVVGEPPQTQLAIHDIALTGSELTVATTSFSGPASLRLSVYDVSDPTVVDQSIAHFETPGFSRAVAVHNGMALVADTQGGLQVVNFIGADTGDVPPQVSLEAEFRRDRWRSGL